MKKTRSINKKPLKILFVAMPNSIHTTRWISQLAVSHWKIHLFSALDIAELHPDLKQITYHLSPGALIDKNEKCIVKTVNWYLPRFKGKIYTIYHRLFYGILMRLFPRIVTPHNALSKVIKKMKPDIVHTLQTTFAGNLLQKSLNQGLKKNFTWVHSTWGSDLVLFGRIKAEKENTRRVLENCDFFLAESNRDSKLAKKMGLKGHLLPHIPAYGGFKENKENYTRTSLRKRIILKGYQSWSGRSLVGLRALERCRDLMSDYEIVIYSILDDVELAAELSALDYGLKFKILSKQISHVELMDYFKSSRIYIGLSISDGLPSSLFEAMAYGAFPIQSKYSCADEWIEHGNTGLLTEANDTDVVEMDLRKALMDNDLVDNASVINTNKIRNELNYKKIQDKVIQMYLDTASYNSNL